MFKDPEINRILSELKEISTRDSKRAENSHKVQHSIEQISSDFLLNLGKKEFSNTDKDLTLGEYLEKYQKVNQVIDSERKQRGQIVSDYEKLVNFVEGAEPQSIKKQKDLFITNKINQQIEGDYQKKEKKTLKTESNKNITDRRSKYANTKITISNDKNVKPLKLKFYSSKED